MEREGNPRENLFPIGPLGRGKTSVQLHFIHEPNFRKAEANWNKRKKRINADRIFVNFGFSAAEPRKDEYLAAFDQLPYHKICMYSGVTTVKNVIYSRRFEWNWFHDKRVEFINFADWMRPHHNFLKVIDILKLLNGEPDLIREG